MPINPNQDPNAGRPVETPQMRDEALADHNALRVQEMVDGGVAAPLAESMVAMKDQMHDLNESNKKLELEVAELKSSLNTNEKKLSNSRGLNKVLGVVAVAAAAVAVWSPFGNDSNETTRTASTPVAANTSEANKTVESNSIFGKLGNAFKVKDAEAKATPALATKTAEDKLQDRIEHADKATSVAFTVKRANPTNANVKAMIEELADGKKIKKADNQRDAWGSLDNAIPLKKVTSADALLGVAMISEANKGVAIGTANLLNGKDPLADSDMTKKQALESIVNDLTKKSTTFRRTTVSGTQNHGFNGESVYRAGVSEAIPALEVTVDGKKVYFKLVCLNGQYKLERTDTPTSVTKTPTSDTPTSKEKTPLTSIIDTPDRNPEDKPNDKPKEDKPKDEQPKDCPTGYVKEGEKCLHPRADGPPKEANQAPRPQPPTPGYKPGNAEAVDATQHGDPTNLNPTQHGTEAPDGAPGGGAGSVVSQPGAGAQTNPEHQPGSASTGTSEGTNDSATDPQAQTDATGETAGAGSAPGNN